MFCEAEWKDVGEILWDSVLTGGKEGKLAQKLGAVWRKVLNTLQTLSAERKAAQALIQTLEGMADIPAEIQKSSKVARFFWYW